MPLPTIANCFRVALNWVGDGRTATNVIHILAPGADENDVGAAIDAAANANMWQCVGDLFGVTSLTITKLDGTPDSVVYPTTDVVTNWSGSGGAQYIPQASALVKLLTGTGGRRGRGRVFLPMLSEGAQDAGQVDGTRVANTTTGWDDFANALVANSPSMALAVASYVGSSANQALAVFCESRSATQRRRQIR